MFLRDGEIVLIDFEEVVDSGAAPARAAECLLWHRIFFADSLTASEAADLFGADGDGTPVLADDHPLPADGFERALLSTESVTWKQRCDLLGQSLRLEGRHVRPTQDRDNGVLYGHELGHFWGDFLPVAEEVRLFRHLSPVMDPTTLVACMEAFEAAMEPTSAVRYAWAAPVRKVSPRPCARRPSSTPSTPTV